jgi:segregation and condensation protein B
METQEIKRVVEALIFAADAPLSRERIIETLELTNGFDLDAVIEELNREYQQSSRTFLIRKVAGGYQLATQANYANWIRKLYLGRHKTRLSQAALETLAVIAFKQPISRVEIAQIRGVNSDGVIGTLLERRLITISGRGEGVGRPLLYSTTPEFLKYFGLNDLSDLPKPREIEELFGKEGMPEELLQVLSQTDAQLRLPIHTEAATSPDTPNLGIESNITAPLAVHAPAPIKKPDLSSSNESLLTASVSSASPNLKAENVVQTVDMKEVDLLGKSVVGHEDEAPNAEEVSPNTDSALAEIKADLTGEIDRWLAEEFAEDEIAEPDFLLKPEDMILDDLRKITGDAQSPTDDDGNISALPSRDQTVIVKSSSILDDIFQDSDSADKLEEDRNTSDFFTSLDLIAEERPEALFDSSQGEAVDPAGIKTMSELAAEPSNFESFFASATQSENDQRSPEPNFSVEPIAAPQTEDQFVSPQNEASETTTFEVKSSPKPENSDFEFFFASEIKKNQSPFDVTNETENEPVDKSNVESVPELKAGVDDKAMADGAKHDDASAQDSATELVNETSHTFSAQTIAAEVSPPSTNEGRREKLELESSAEPDGTNQFGQKDFSVVPTEKDYPLPSTALVKSPHSEKQLIIAPPEKDDTRSNFRKRAIDWIQKAFKRLLDFARPSRRFREVT